MLLLQIVATMISLGYFALILMEEESFMQSSYEKWLREKVGISENSIKHYIGALKTVSEQFNSGIFEITDFSTFEVLKQLIFNNDAFKLMNKTGNQMYSAALNHYERFLRQNISWVEAIVETLENLDGKAPLSDIYQNFSLRYPQMAVGTFENTIRARIYENSSDSKHYQGKKDLFYSDSNGNGVWGLRRFFSMRLAEEVGSNELKEGAVKTIKVNAYERNLKARKQCIEHYGAVCYVCGFDFSKYYGNELKGLIHVHHLIPLADIASEYIIDPINDLRPVCPNCHLVIHKKVGGTYSIEEVRLMIESALK